MTEYTDIKQRKKHIDNLRGQQFSYRKIGEIVGLSRERVRQIHLNNQCTQKSRTKTILWNGIKKTIVLKY